MSKTADNTRRYFYEVLEDGSIQWTEKMGRTTMLKGIILSADDPEFDPSRDGCLNWESVFDIFTRHKKLKITVLEQ